MIDSEPGIDPSGPILEPLRREDLAKVKDLIADGVLELYADLDFLPKTRPELLAHYDRIGYLADLDAFEREYGEGDGAFLVLKDAAGVQGCGGVHRLEGSRGELARLWLRREARGKGWGERIIAELFRRAAAIGYRELYLDTSHRCTAALALFRKHGFRECERYKESIGDIYMKKSLESR